MSNHSRFTTALCALSLSVALAGLPASADAQQQEEEEGPGTRVTTVTSFQVPFNDRPVVMPFLVERVIPATQLNPNVITFRVLLHNWGGDASDVTLVAEYADFADIEAECGQPCDDYFEAHPAPEEGEDGYEDFQEAQRLFSKYYSHHRDEIYVAPMSLAKVEGTMMGPVGGPEDEGEGGTEGEGETEDEGGN